MKKALVALAIAAFASSAFAAIATSSHDLTADGRGAYGGQLSACQYCHAPHNVNLGVPGAPLWNRNSVTTSFTYYTSNTMDATPATSLNANSMTCMSCHDGVSDMGDTYTGSAGFTTATPLTTFGAASYAIIGSDLRNDHPVSIRYVAAENVLAATTDVATAGLKLYGATETVECASCHDPHGNGLPGGGSDGAAGGEAFLRVSAATICTKCHLK